MNGLGSRIGVVFGGPSPEHDVSILTGLQAVRGLARVAEVGEVHALYWSKIGAWFRVPNTLEASDFRDGAPAGSASIELLTGPSGGFATLKGRFSARLEALDLDAVVNCCHGGPGEDGSLQAAFDLAGISYSGPSRSSAMLGMDKLATAAVLRAAGVSVLPRVLLSPETNGPGFNGPFILKPRFGGSSIGIDVVADLETARARLSANVHLRAGAVLEPYRSDLFDLQLAIVTYPDVVLSAIERPLRARTTSSILGYRDKYVGGEGMDAAPRELPADLDDSLAKELRTTAVQAAECLGARGVARIDFLSDGRELYVNEINTIPGSLSRHLFIDPRLQFEDLLSRLVHEAIERPSSHFSTAGADGLLLRDAASIAAKLA